MFQEKHFLISLHLFHSQAAGWSANYPTRHPAGGPSSAPATRRPAGGPGPAPASRGCAHAGGACPATRRVCLPWAGRPAQRRQSLLRRPWTDGRPKTPRATCRKLEKPKTGRSTIGRPAERPRGARAPLPSRAAQTAGRGSRRT